MYKPCKVHTSKKAGINILNKQLKNQFMFAGMQLTAIINILSNPTVMIYKTNPP